MKGIVMSSALITFLMSLIFSISLYISFESDRFQVQQALKSALRSTMIHCVKFRCDSQESFDRFVSDVQWIAVKYTPFKVDLLGYHGDPLLIRIKVTTKGGVLDIFDLIFEETMIEEESNEDT
jgi:hypothetical protein